MTRSLSRCQAKLLKGFPKLTSLVFESPETLYHLSSLTGLTKVSITCNDGLEHEPKVDGMCLDLTALTDLPNLHTLNLQCVVLWPTGWSSIMSDFTQLQALQLKHCCSRDGTGTIAQQDDQLSRAGPQDLSKLPQLSCLQIVDSPMWLVPGLTNLQKVR